MQSKMAFQKLLETLNLDTYTFSTHYLKWPRLYMNKHMKQLITFHIPSKYSLKSSYELIQIFQTLKTWKSNHGLTQYWKSFHQSSNEKNDQHHYT